MATSINGEAILNQIKKNSQTDEGKVSERVDAPCLWTLILSWTFKSVSTATATSNAAATASAASKTLIFKRFF